MKRVIFSIRMLARDLLIAARLTFRVVRAKPYAGWTEAPLQQLTSHVMAASGIRGRHKIFRHINQLSGAMLKYREIIHAYKINYQLTVRGNLDQASLRNLVVVQREIQMNTEVHDQMSVNLNVHFETSNSESGIGTFFSALGLSSLFTNINFYWDAAAIVDDEFLILTQDEKAWTDAPPDRFCFDLNAIDPVALRDAELGVYRRAFARLLDPRKVANAYLKAAHPKKTIVAVSLRETIFDLVEEEIVIWGPMLVGLQDAFPEVRFIVVNRVSDNDSGGWRAFPELTILRNVGFGFHDAMALTACADAYFGVLDFFGMGAKSLAKPGVYIPLDYEISNEPSFLLLPDDPCDVPVWLLEKPTIAAAKDSLEVLLQDLQRTDYA